MICICMNILQHRVHTMNFKSELIIISCLLGEFILLFQDFEAQKNKLICIVGITEFFTESAYWADSVHQSQFLLYVSCPLPMRFILGLSSALRSHDHFEASECSTLLHYQTFQRFQHFFLRFSALFLLLQFWHFLAVLALCSGFSTSQQCQHFFSNVSTFQQFQHFLSVLALFSDLSTFQRFQHFLAVLALFSSLSTFQRFQLFLAVLALFSVLVLFSGFRNFQQFQHFFFQCQQFFAVLTLFSGFRTFRRFQHF